ncbi:phosphatidylglycerol lysyltransferase domain-containing protein [Prosthecobacter fusiformis]|nr:phosphatidylglycerol lysyltransferase domain-containing protein [Prosthecobacter fusiformis]
MPPQVLRLIFLLSFSLIISAHAQDADDDGPTPKASVQLTHGMAKIRLYEPDEIPPRAIVIFGSGDGGWSPWEDSVAHWLRGHGAYVVGFDLRAYATKDYDQRTLGLDMAALAAEATRRCEGAEVPIIYSGWSMGAVQAVAAAGGKERPASLAGLLLFSADSRGRYGLREKDELGITPQGPGTFGLSEFNAAMKNLRVAQFHGGADFMASTAWVQSLKSPKALYLVPGANHGFDGPDDSFEEWVARGFNWVLGDNGASSAPPVHDSSLPWGLSPLWPAAALAIVLSLIFIFSRKHSLRILVWAVTIMAWLNLLEAMTVKPPEALDWMDNWLPLGISDNSRILLLFSGIGLLALARGLRRHKHMAWLLAVIMLCVSVIVHLTRAFQWHHALAAMVLLAPLIRWRSTFLARSDAPSLRFAFISVPVLALSLLIYGVTGLRQFSERGEFGEALSWTDCVNGTASAIILQKSNLDTDGSRNVRIFLSNVRGGSLLSALAVVILMLRPVLKKRMPEATAEERDRVARLIDQHGKDPMDSFALLEDKRYFFSQDSSGFIAYALWRKYAVALADPVCAQDMRPALIIEFTTYCARQDWEPLFYCAHVSNRQLYEEAGFVTVKVGEDARLETADFKLEGGKFQNLRTARNKARKNGLTYQWYDARPAPDHGLEAQLQLLSQDWLENKHGGEMTFDLGSFDIPTLRTHGVSIVRNPEGRIEAFATWWPYAQGKGRCLDLMRGRDEVRDVMDFLIVEAIDHFKTLGVEQVSLGNAPLANIDATQEDASLSREERAVKFLFDNFDRFYGYKSLFNFKKKYQPEWQGRYLAYQPRTRLAMVALAVAGVHLPRGFKGLIGS